MAALAAAWMVACTSAPPSERPASELPVYEGEQARLFDDSFSPRLVTSLVSTGAAEGGAQLVRTQAKEADGVFTARVTTIDEDTRAGQTTYRVTLVPVAAIAGDSPNRPLAVTIPRDHPSYGMIRSGRPRLIGQRPVVFLKYFQQDGSVSPHMRVEPDDEATRQAITAGRL